MRISAGLYRRIASELSKHGIQLGETPVLQLATSPEALQKLETALPSVLTAIENNSERQEAEKFLKEVIESAKKVEKGLNGGLQEFKNAVISLLSSYLSNWDIDKHMLKHIAALIPEVYVDKKHAYLVTDEHEASALVSMYPETVKNVLKEYAKRSIRSIDLDEKTCRISVMNLEFTVYRIGNVVSMLYRLDMTDKANEVLVKAIRSSLNNARFVTDVQSPTHDSIVIGLNPAEMYLGNIDRSIIAGATIYIIGKLRYTESSGVSDAYIEMNSPVLGIIRIPAYGFSIEDPDAPLRFVTNATDSLRIFLAKYSPVLLAINEEARKYGFEMKPEVSSNSEYKAVYEKSVDGIVATVDTEIRMGLITAMTGEITANIKGVKKLKERLGEILSQYRYYHPTLSVNGDTVKIRLEIPVGELKPEIFSVLNTLMQDLTMISHSATSGAKPLNHLALFTTLTALGVKTPLETSSKFAKLTQTELIAEMRVALAAKNLDANPEAFMSEPDKIVDMLVESGELTVDRYLEPVLMGTRVRDLLMPFEELEMQYNIDVVISALSAYIAKSFYAKKGSTILEYLAEPLPLNTVYRYVEELGGPMNLRTLLLPTQEGGRTVWNAMTPDLKYKALLLMDPAEIKALDRAISSVDTGASRNVEDLLLIVEAYCEKTTPATCTDYILTEHPNLVQIPRTAKIVEDSDTKWIELGIYRLQIEKFRRDGIVFRVLDRVTGNTYRVRAHDIREAVKKVSIGEDVEVITA